jgi:hypothetical protein
MNRFLRLTVFFIVFSGPLWAQGPTLVNQVLASTGHAATLNGWQWSYTVGEGVIATLEGTGFGMTQGFHQPEFAAFVATHDLDLEAWQLAVFPNPTADRLTVRYRDEAGRTLVATVVDLLGRTVLANEPLPTASGSQLDCSAFQPGAYLLFLREPVSGASATVRFIRL